MVSAILFLSQKKGKMWWFKKLHYDTCDLKSQVTSTSSLYLSYGIYLFDEGALYTLNYMSLQNDCLQNILL